MDEAKMWFEKAVYDPSKTEDDKEVCICIKMGLFKIKTRNLKLHKQG